MYKVAKSCIKKGALIILWMCSLALALIALVPAYLIGNTQHWLNSEAGQHLVKTYTMHQARQSGVNLKIGRIDFALPQSLTVSSLRVSQGTHDITIDHVSLVGAKVMDAGKIALRGRYNDLPVSLSASYNVDGDDLELNDLLLNAPDLSLNAPHLLADVKRKTVSGCVSGSLESLKPYHGIVGMGHDIAPLKFVVRLPEMSAAQGITASLKTPYYKNAQYGVALSDIALDAEMAGANLMVRNFRARDDKGGTLNASGRYHIVKGGAVEAQLKINNFNAPRHDMAHGLLDADLNITGTLQALKAKGVANVQQLDIKLPDRFNTAIPTLDVITPREENQRPSAPISMDLDITINAPQKIFVRGWGLDAEFGGSLHVTGAATKPNFDGKFSVLRGRFSEFGRVFKLERASLDFAGTIPPEPRLDVMAETKVDDVMAAVIIKGQAVKPKISFSATPSMPDDQVLSHILFGKTIDDISPFQAAQLAATLARFSGTAPSGGGVNIDPVGAVRSAIGLDDLSVETDKEGKVSVGAGKYIADNVYLEVEAGTAEQGGSANVEIELTPNITLESEIGQDASGGAGIFWKWDY